MSATNPPAKTWSNLDDRVLMAENISIDRAAAVDSAPTAPPPPPAETMASALNHRPANIVDFQKALPPFLTREFVEQHAEYERKFNAFTEQMGLADESRANAEYDRRRNLVAENPTPENLAVLAQESHDELKKKYGERRAVFEGLRAQCIQKHAAALCRMLLPIVEKNVAAFRKQIDADFRTLHRHYGVPYSSENNPAIRAVDHWWSSRHRTLVWENEARQNRFPHAWEAWLPGPDFFREVTAGNFTVATNDQPLASASPLKTTAGNATPIAPAAISAAVGTVRTAADVAAQRAA
jgi:hypothetical protein